MVDIDQRIKAEWRALGFYYELVENKNRNEWHFYGSRQGLQHFLELLDEYTNNPAKISTPSINTMDLTTT